MYLKDMFLFRKEKSDSELNHSDISISLLIFRLTANTSAIPKKNCTNQIMPAKSQVNGSPTKPFKQLFRIYQAYETQSIAKEAGKIFSSFNRSTKYTNPFDMPQFYKSQIKPRMENRCHIWAEAEQYLLSSLGKVQKNYTLFWRKTSFRLYSSFQINTTS